MPYKDPSRGKIAQKKWRQSRDGVICERRNKGMIIPDEDKFWESYQTKNCDLCDISFDEKRKCVDHCHHSGYVRFIICNKCNRNLGSIDNNRMKLHLELYRYFNLKNILH